MPERTGYSLAQIALHWLIAVLIVAAYSVSDDMDDTLEERIAAGVTGTEGNTVHVWLGGTVFALVLIRIGVRLVRGAPGPLPGTPPALALAATWGHRLLYLLMALVPMLGAVAWYGHLEAAGEAHEFMVNVLLLAAAGHVVAALWHAFWLGDSTISRMTIPGGGA